jgi:hypothetical protein
VDLDLNISFSLRFGNRFPVAIIACKARQRRE